VYALIDLRPRGLRGCATLVTALEQAVIGYAAQLGIAALARREAPGVYVDGAKLASVGVRIRRGASYHGLALNVNMDLEAVPAPSTPADTPGLTMTQLADLSPVIRGRHGRGRPGAGFAGGPWVLHNVTRL